MSKIKVFLFVLISILVLLIGFFTHKIYQQWVSYPSNSPQGEYKLYVEPGDAPQTIANKLQADNVIHDSKLFLLRAKLNPIENLQIGEYTLILPADAGDIIKQLNVQSEIIRQQNLQVANRPAVKVILREGLTLDDYAQILYDAKVINDKQKFLDFAKEPANFDKQKYPFLPKPLDCAYGNIQNCAKYYPEGYLYPDTYQFFLESTITEVYDKILTNFKTKVWSKVADQVTKANLDFEKIVILASVLEKETGRTKGITSANLDEVNQERKLMAQVFYNRLAKNMKWQSDVTIEYGTGRKVCQQTFKVDNCFLLDDPIVKHKYNTYLNIGYPIGPVSNPQFFNIEAAINPIPNDYLFFVSDVTGKKYFAKTEEEHFALIRKVNQINRELGA